MASEEMPNPLGSEEYSLSGFLEVSIVGFEVNVVYNGSLMESGKGHSTVFQRTSAKTSLCLFNLSSFICSF